MNVLSSSPRQEGRQREETMPTLLSRAERTILLLLFFGRSHRDIAEQLQLTPDAVKSSIAVAMRKLGGATDYAVVAKALRRRLLRRRPRASTLKRLGVRRRV
jgi:DNA-binding NarL/FixJ family response regulator